jgi:hypothetical protein
MPLLRHLELDGHWGDSLITGDEAPLLRTLIIRDESDLSNMVMPWVQLTSLTMELVFTHECAPILQQASNLILARWASSANPQWTMHLDSQISASPS